MWYVCRNGKPLPIEFISEREALEWIEGRTDAHYTVHCKKKE